jgi:hypothetical protein
VKAKPEPKVLLQQIARIPEMERGKLCRMRASSTRAYYNHQTWEKGRNVVRYVPREQVLHLQKAITGYQQYLKLTQAYAEGIIRRTRQKQAAKPSPPPTQNNTKPNKTRN